VDLVLDTLDSLVAQGFAKHAEGDAARFTMLETIREFALEQLAVSGEAACVRRRHAEQFTAMAERSVPGFVGPDQIEWFARLDAEQDNIRAALAWAVERGEAELGLRLSGALYYFWRDRGLWAEGCGWLEGLLALSPHPAPTAARARALAAVGELSMSLDEFPTARVRYEEALALAREVGDGYAAMLALEGLSWVHHRRGETDAGDAAAEEALAVARRLGQTWHAGAVLHQQARVALDRGDRPSARSFLGQCCPFFRDAGAPSGRGRALFLEGQLSWLEGDALAARAALEESLTIFRQLGNPAGIMLCQERLGALARGLGQHEVGRAAFLEALAMNRRNAGERGGTARALQYLGGLAAEQGHAARAARLFCAAESLRDSIGVIVPPLERANYERDLGSARSALGEGPFCAPGTRGARCRWTRSPRTPGPMTPTFRFLGRKIRHGPRPGEVVRSDLKASPAPDRLE
jgi:tetratricopeptide (TPR) repeat protein